MKNSTNIKRLFSKYSYSLVLVGILAIWVIVMACLSQKFLTTANIFTVLTRMSEECIAAVGVTMVVLLGGIDLSVGAIMALVPVVISKLYEGGMSFVPALLIAFACGILVGVLNAFLIQRTKIQPMIATLATMTITRSIVYCITMGMPLSLFPDAFFQISKGQLFGINYPVYAMVIFVVLGTFFLKRTRMGRFIYSVGGNEKAAKASGIDVAKVKYTVFMLSALCASVAGTMLASRLNTANSDAGLNTGLDVLTAVLLGGTSIAGGEGSLPLTVIGVLIMSLLVNGFNLLNISSYWQLTVTGVLLILIVGMDAKRRDGGLEKLRCKLRLNKMN